MKEVSCKNIGSLLRDAERRGVPPEKLIRGTKHDLAYLRNGKERVDWDQFVLIMQNARAVLGDDGIVELGKGFADSPFLRSLATVASLLFTPKDFYFYINKGPKEGGGGTLFTNMRPTIREVGPRRLEVDLLTEEGYSLCREFYLFTQGAFAVVPVPLGLPEATVRMEDIPRGVRYHIEYPEGGGVLRRMTRAVTWPLHARAMAKQLMEANEVLETRYQDLDQARLKLAHQAAQLQIAHTVNELVQQNLDLGLTLEAVAKALVEQAGFARAQVRLDVTIDDVTIQRSAEKGALGKAPLERPLRARGGAQAGVLVAHVAADSEVAIKEELLDFVLPGIEMALDNAISYLVVDEYRRGLERRVDERTAELREATDTLAGTVRDLEAAKEARDRIFANLNHDLRSPLSLILLAVAEARRTNAIADAAGARTLAGIEHGARRVLRMVDELLLLAEGREGDVRLRVAAVDLAAMTVTVGEAWKPAATVAGLTLEHSVEPEIVVRADPSSVERILANLVSNAIKFTPAGGAIKVRLARVDGRARLEVEDSGPGIDPALRPKLFGRFERGTNTTRTAISGSGLGLSLVKELAEAQGGTVSIVDPEGSGRPHGALFRVELPIVAESATGDAVALKLRPQDYGAAIDKASGPTLFEPPAGVTPRATILLAEDDPELRNRTAALLAEEYRVFVAPDGLTALELAQRHTPDLLVTDVNMPGMDGFELTRRFRSLPNARLAPVLILTTFGAIGDRLTGFEAGAVDYIHKPFEPPELKARLRSQLTIRGLALQLLETEKLAALGTLSAGLAHEIRNPANGIINAVAPLRELLPPETLEPGSPTAQLLDVVEHCSKQVAAMSRQLLGFKRGVEPKRENVSLPTLISRVCTTVSPSLEGIELRSALEYRGTVHCAEPLIAQVLTNLVQNGAHAAGRGGWVEVRTGLHENRVVVEIRDSGPGVRDELRERIFEPFFTTKPAGRGTGLGLSTARDIVLRHGGTLDARSSSGRTVFRMELPQPS